MEFSPKLIMPFSFNLEVISPTSKARTSRLITPHGEVQTPVFMPVGTQGSVKAVAPWELERLGAQIILGNAYHLYLRPGHERVARLGGLHQFTGWSRPMLTDSGGFQVFSLAHIRQISDDGVAFRSHIDGSDHFLSPERVMEIEQALGADIAMVLDEPSAYPSAPEQVRAATERTHRWAERCLLAHSRSDQALFAIVQGGFEPELRRWSTEALVAMDFPGYAIGGLSLGEPKEQTWAMVDAVTGGLPAEKPRYLMGVGSPEDVLEAIYYGVDMFDSSFPTRIARNGALLMPTGRANIRNARFADDNEPPLPGCDCAACAHFSAAYLRHLFMSQELLAFQLASIHNLRFMVRLVEQARFAIEQGVFEAFRTQFLAQYQSPDAEVRADQKAKWMAARNRRPLTQGAEESIPSDAQG